MKVTVAAPVPNEFVLYLPGPQGPKGDKGTVWLSGIGAPATSLGEVNDWYLNTDNGDAYEKTGVSTWTLRDNLTGRAATDTAQTWTRAQTFAPDGNYTPLTIKANVAQTSDLTQWTNSAGTVLTSISSIGGLVSNVVPSGPGFSGFAEQLKANHNISGGGTVTFTGNSELRWTSRFIVISNGRGSHFGTSGYFDIAMPPDGTVIPGVGGAADKTVTAGGVPMAGWIALYYILPIGTTNGTQNGNFRLAFYTADLEIPANWVLIAARNGDNGSLWVSPAKISLIPGNVHNTTLGTGRSQFVTLSDVQTLSGAKTFSAGVTVNNRITTQGITATRGNTLYTNNVSDPSHVDIQSGGVDKPGLRIYAGAGQLSNLTQWHNSAGTLLSRVAPDGTIYIGSDRVLTEADTASGNVVTTNTAQTISGAKTFSASETLLRAPAGITTLRIEADPGNDPTQEDSVPEIIFSQDGRIVNTRIGGRADNNFEIMAQYSTGSVNIGTGGITRFTVQGDGNINFTGTLVGGTVPWARLSGIPSYVTTDTAQTITATKIFDTPATAVDIIVRGAVSQTADLTQWQNSNGTVLAKVSAGGVFFEGSRRIVGDWGQHVNHGTFKDFNDPGLDFGAQFIQGTLNGPGITGATQYYNMNISLGANYTFGQYAMQFAIPRNNIANPYPAVRWREAGTWTAWTKIHAGYADTAGTATPSNDANLVHRDGAETITGVKTFSANPVVNNGAWTIAKTAGLQAELDSKYSGTNVPPYPVTSVSGRTGAVVLGPADVGATTAATANAIAQRDSAGDITARLFRSTYTVVATAAQSNFFGVQVNTSSDNYLRPASAANVKARMVTEGLVDTTTTQTITASKTFTSRVVSDAGFNDTGYLSENIFSGPVRQGTTYGTQRFIHGGGTDLAWKVLATVNLPATNLYTGSAWEVEVYDSRGNHGQTYWQKQRYTITINRSGAVADNNVTQTIWGPDTEFLRVVRVDAGTAEIQGRTPALYRHVTFDLRPISHNGASWSFASPVGGLPAGNTTGTIELAKSNTADITQMLNVAFISRGAFGTTAIHNNALISATGVTPTHSVAVMRGAASQTANLTEWQNSAGTVLSRIAPDGVMYIGNDRVLTMADSGSGNLVTTDTAQTITGAKTFDTGAAVVDLTIKAAASQTANLTEWRNSAGAVMSAITPAGELIVGTTTFRDNPKAHGTLEIAGVKTGYAGIRFADAGRTLMVSATTQGMYNSDTSAWQWYFSNGTLTVGTVTPARISAGTFGGVGGYGITGSLGITANAATVVPQVVKAAASQTADLAQWQNSAGTVLARIANDGTMYRGTEVVGGNAADTEILGFMGAY